jgi:hypothetical protein
VPNDQHVGFGLVEQATPQRWTGGLGANALHVRARSRVPDRQAHARDLRLPVRGQGAQEAGSTAGQPIPAISPTKPTRSSDNAEIPRPQRRRSPRLPIASSHRRADGSCPPKVRRSPSPSCSSMTNLRGTFHQHRLTVERLAVQLQGPLGDGR